MNPISARYKIPLLISLVISLALIAFRAESYWLNAIYIFLGGIVGFIFLDMEYLIYAYVIDPMTDIAAEIKSYLAQKNIKEFLRFINENEHTFGEVSIRSMLFQVTLCVFTLYVVTTNSWVFVQSMCLSMLASLIYYQIIEFQRTRTLERWFWIYSGKLSEGFYKAYVFVMFLIFIVQFSFI